MGEVVAVVMLVVVLGFAVVRPRGLPEAVAAVPAALVVLLTGALGWLSVEEIYGAAGIVIAEVFAVFPHALMILVTALRAADARLYEAADSMGTSAARKFFTITLPGAKYGLISASLVVFTLVITDFGIPKVIGGSFNVLATDVFKLVIGQQDFQRGAVVALLLLAPAMLTYVVDRAVGRKQTAMLSARAVPYRPKRAPLRDQSCVLQQVYVGDEETPRLDRQFALTRDSQCCVDSAQADATVSVDYDGSPRPQGLGYDMGCYELR